MMWVLLALSVVGTLLFIERLLYLHRGQIRSTAFVGGIKNILAKRRLMEALTVCEETPGPVAAVVKSALLHADEDEQKMRLAVQEAALVEIPVSSGGWVRSRRSPRWRRWWGCWARCWA